MSDAFDDQLFPLLIDETKDEMVADRLMNKLQYLAAVDRQKKEADNRKGRKTALQSPKVEQSGFS